jgi:hypothetical protein
LKVPYGEARLPSTYQSAVNLEPRRIAKGFKLSSGSFEIHGNNLNSQFRLSIFISIFIEITPMGLIGRATAVNGGRIAALSSGHGERSRAKTACIAPDLAQDDAPHSAQIGAQLPVGALELLGMGVALMRDQRDFPKRSKD